MNDFSPDLFKEKWDCLSLRYDDLSKEKRKTAKKEIQEKLKNHSELYPMNSIWPSKVETNVMDWPDKAVGRAGKAFILRTIPSLSAPPVLMMSPSGKAMILEWNAELFKELLSMVSDVLDSIEEGYIWKIKNRMKSVPYEAYEGDMPGTVLVINEAITFLSCHGLVEKVDKAWKYIFPDISIPRRIYMINNEGIKEISKKDNFAEQLACVINDALETFPEKNDEFAIMESDDGALSLWNWDTDDSLSFFLAVMEIVVEGGLE